MLTHALLLSPVTLLPLASPRSSLIVLCAVLRTLYTSNYEIETSSAIEWAFVATPDKMPEGGWPIEKKLERAFVKPVAKLKRSGSEAALVASGAHMRQPMPLDVLNSLMADKNVKLEELGEPALMLAEMFASRLYTGPLFVKYNGVLRGLDSPVRASPPPIPPGTLVPVFLRALPPPALPFQASPCRSRAPTDPTTCAAHRCPSSSTR